MTDDLVSRLRARDAEWQAMCDRWQQQADEMGQGRIMRENDQIIRSTIYAEAANEIERLERLRPHWAKGFTSDSVAAQTTINALNAIWSMLGVDNQTAAMDRLRQLMQHAERELAQFVKVRPSLDTDGGQWVSATPPPPER